MHSNGLLTFFGRRALRLSSSMAIGVSSVRRMRSNEASSDSNTLAKRAGAALTMMLFRNAGWRAVDDHHHNDTHEMSIVNQVSVHSFPHYS